MPLDHPSARTIAAACGAVCATVLMASFTDAAGAQERRLCGHDDSVYALAVSPDGRLLASTSADETVKL
ncbi:hypothetical protein, partial [Salmonella enterica]|uniref:hypothetical protein n=1 Tax=Salmonella enterica TaxID=28901 RepID=UPI003CEDE3DE